MLYLANPTGSTRVHDAMATGTLGYIDTPLQGNQRPTGVIWCADNGCFNDKTFDERRWWDWLQGNAGAAADCLFAVAPDVVGDAAATIARSAPWLPRIRALGYKAAFVAQNGQEALPVPWSEFDVLFIGGTTEWKLGPHVRRLVADAKARGKHVHMGRVNSLRRLQYAQAIGCDSVDGTYLTYGPETNLPRLVSWVTRVQLQEQLFTIEDDQYRWGSQESADGYTRGEA